MLYYLIQGGVQTGPFPVEALLSQGMTRDSYVWREGLAEWTRAADVPELRQLFEFTHEEAPRYGQPQTPPNFNPLEQPQYRMPVPHTNWLPWSVVVLVVGFFTSCIGGIFGLVGMIQANKANDAYSRGDSFLGEQANSSARTLIIIGGVIAALGIMGNAFLLMRLPNMISWWW